MRSFKGVVAITLCFCLIILSSSSIQVAAKYNHKPFVEKVDLYFKNKNYKTLEKKKYFVASKKHDTQDFVVFKGKSKKHTKKVFKNMQKKTSRDYNYSSYFMFEKINKRTLWAISHSDKGYLFVFVKMNIKKCRIIWGGIIYSHKQNAKRIKQIKKWLRKTVNKVDSF